MIHKIKILFICLISILFCFNDSTAQQPLGLFGFEPYQIYEMPSYSEFGRKALPSPVRRHAKFSSSAAEDSESLEDLIISGESEEEEEEEERKINNYRFMSEESNETEEEIRSKKFLELIATSKVKKSARRRPKYVKKGKIPLRVVNRRRKVTTTTEVPVTVITPIVEKVMDQSTTNIENNRYLPTNQKIENNTNKKTPIMKTNKRKPVDKLAVEQLNRVIETAEQLNILEKNNKFNNIKEITIATPKGTYEEGSIMKIKMKKNGPNMSGFSIDLRRGPYESAYHTQIHNDYDQVMAMLGTPADTRVTPDIPKILDKIMLKQAWEIHRLR